MAPPKAPNIIEEKEKRLSFHRLGTALPMDEPIKNPSQIKDFDFICIF